MEGSYNASFYSFFKDFTITGSATEATDFATDRLAAEAKDITNSEPSIEGYLKSNN
jgi:hypothetical protein